MSAGIGEKGHPEEWQKLRDAAQAYGVAVYGEDYICHEFILAGFMVSMTGDTEYSEYVLGTSSPALHINEGLLRRALDMILHPPEDDDE